MINTVLRYDLPSSVKACLTFNEDMSHTVFINGNLSPEQQQIALHHEYQHITHPDASEADIHALDFEPRLINLSHCKPTGDYISFRTAGVTYDTDGQLRQELLRHIKNDIDAGLSHTVALRSYLFGVEPAVYVLINNQIVGNVPRLQVSEVLSADIRGLKKLSVYGGQDGRALGCALEIWRAA